MFNNSILDAIRAYKELQIFIKQLEDEAEAHKQSIISAMEEQDIDSLLLDVYTVKYTAYTSQRVDTTSLKKELPDIAARFTKTTQGKRFTVA